MGKPVETVTNFELGLPCQCVSAICNNTWHFLPGVCGVLYKVLRINANGF